MNESKVTQIQQRNRGNGFFAPQYNAANPTQPPGQARKQPRVVRRTEAPKRIDLTTRDMKFDIAMLKLQLVRFDAGVSEVRSPRVIEAMREQLNIYQRELAVRDERDTAKRAAELSDATSRAFALQKLATPESLREAFANGKNHDRFRIAA